MVIFLLCKAMLSTILRYLVWKPPLVENLPLLIKQINTRNYFLC